jgi:hypothetical protein
MKPRALRSLNLSPTCGQWAYKNWQLQKTAGEACSSGTPLEPQNCNEFAKKAAAKWDAVAGGKQSNPKPEPQFLRKLSG